MLSLTSGTATVKEVNRSSLHLKRRGSLCVFHSAQQLAMTIFVVINFNISGLKTCSIENDHLNGAACIARLPPSVNIWMGMCCFQALFTSNNSQSSAGHGEDPIERSSAMARR
jgi:hypothetical protein